MPVSVSSLPAAQAGTITLGGDLIVNRMGYGAMRITGQGIWGPPADVDAALATLRRAAELGVNFIDTADSYGPDVSEELIAQALYPYPAGLVIATKAGGRATGPAFGSTTPAQLTSNRLLKAASSACAWSGSTSTSCTFPIRPYPLTPRWKPWRGSKNKERFAT